MALWQWVQGLQSKEFARKDAIEAFEFPIRTIELIIKKLCDMKRLTKIGQGRGTRYRVLEKTVPNERTLKSFDEIEGGKYTDMNLSDFRESIDEK